jgi:hypothetical protein
MSAGESLLLAAIGTVMLVGIAFALGFGRVVPFSGPDAARAAIEDWLPGAVVVALALSSDGRAALARVQGGALVLAVAHGDRSVVGIVDGTQLVRPAPGLLEVAAGGLGRPARSFAFAPRDLDSVLA